MMSANDGGYKFLMRPHNTDVLDHAIPDYYDNLRDTDMPLPH